ncbi:hypothetical protein PENTCL1PPCAC_29618 [Pristionchus entomophagus]|uniref:GTP 3',8-cyclase n=1 Tax=Pristionchus entomophagus TaxID=358040 RepID=A0AAV5UKD1_9BILA|nr:hypothetical protein PENTCL1PPCAC_29618 [Pristionchus entomophagus]
MGSRLGPLVRSSHLLSARLISDSSATTTATTAAAANAARSVSDAAAAPPPVDSATELSRESQLRNRRVAIQAAIREKAATSLLPPFEDNFGRKHTYLRIALTEKCNLRCLYCMPAEGVPLTPKPHLLTVDEIIRIVEVFAAHGMDKIRLTGGEPSVRKDFTDIVRRIKAVEGVTQIGVTTNGIAIGKRLHELKEAGLSQMNISLDSLNPEKYMMITRTNGFKKVMETINNAEGIFDSVKVNVVVMKNVNDMEICDFIEMTKDRNLSVRFIEFMPFGGNKFTLNKFFSFKDMWKRVEERFGDRISRLVDTPNDTTKAFRIRGYQGEFGFITSMTEHFCSTCNRVRVTADGNLKVCLHGNNEVSLRDVMRSGASNEELSETIAKAVKRKKKQHAGVENLQHLKNRPMILIGG